MAVAIQAGELLLAMPKAKGSAGRLAGKTKGTSKGRGGAKAVLVSSGSDAAPLEKFGIDKKRSSRALSDERRPQIDRLALGVVRRLLGRREIGADARR